MQDRQRVLRAGPHSSTPSCAGRATIIKRSEDGSQNPAPDFSFWATSQYLQHKSEQQVTSWTMCSPVKSHLVSETMGLHFRGFDSSIILILRCGVLMSIVNLPESLSQRILVGISLEGGLHVFQMGWDPKFLFSKGGQQCMFFVSGLKRRIATQHEDLPKCMTLEKCLISDPPFTKPPIWILPI